MLVLCTAVGLSVEDLSEAGGPFLGVNEIRFLEPVYPGDTLSARSTVVDARESGSRPDFGIVTWETEASNQTRRGRAAVSPHQPGRQTQRQAALAGAAPPERVAAPKVGDTCSVRGGRPVSQVQDLLTPIPDAYYSDEREAAIQEMAREFAHEGGAADRQPARPREGRDPACAASKNSASSAFSGS